MCLEEVLLISLSPSYNMFSVSAVFRAYTNIGPFDCSFSMKYIVQTMVLVEISRIHWYLKVKLMPYPYNFMTILLKIVLELWLLIIEYYLILMIIGNKLLILCLYEAWKRNFIGFQNAGSVLFIHINTFFYYSLYFFFFISKSKTYFSLTDSPKCSFRSI